MKALQKLLGLLIIIINILAARAVSDGTAAIVLIPLGVYLVVTHDIVLTIPSRQRVQIKKHPFSLAGRKGA